MEITMAYLVPTAAGATESAVDARSALETQQLSFELAEGPHSSK